MEEGSIHPELQLQAPTEPLPELPHHDPQEAVRIVRIVDIAGPIPDPKDLTQLCHLHAQGIIRGVLGMMRVETAGCASHVASRPQHIAIEI